MMAGISAAGGAHERGGGGLVAVGEQDDAVEGVAADHLFGIHGGEVAVEHGCWAKVDFAEGDGGEFEGRAAGLEDAAFDGIGEGAEVAVAGVELAVGVADANEGAGHIGAVVAHGGGEGAVGQARDAVFVEECLGAGEWGHGSGFLFFFLLPQSTPRAHRGHRVRFALICADWAMGFGTCAKADASIYAGLRWILALTCACGRKGKSCKYSLRKLDEGFGC